MFTYVVHLSAVTVQKTRLQLRHRDTPVNKGHSHSLKEQFRRTLVKF